MRKTPHGRARTSDDLRRQLAELKAANAALRESEEKYRTLFETMGHGYALIEVCRDEAGNAVDMRFLEFNPAVERLVGVAAAELVGRLTTEVFPDTQPVWWETYDKVIRAGEPARFEQYFAPSKRWYEVYVYPAGSDRVIVMYEDATERKRTIDALQASEERFQQFADSSLSAIWIRDARTFAFEYVSPAVYSIYGVTPEAVLQDDQLVNSILLPDERARVTARVERIGRGETLVQEYRIRRASDQKLRWIRSVGFPLRSGGGGEIRRIAAITEDVTGLYEAQQALRDSEERFRQFADASSDALWIRDAETLSMEYVSPAMRGIYGIEPETILGEVNRWASLIVPDDRDIALNHLTDARKGDAVIHEFRIQRPTDGSFRWIRDTDFPLLDQYGRIQRIGGIAQDITEAKLASQHQGVLLGELQHRVRNIMAMIRSITARTGERAENVPEYAALMTGRLLALARVQALLTRAPDVSVSVASIVQDEVSAQAQHEEQYQIEGPNVSLSAKAAEVLTLAIHELATNALKYGALSVPDGKVNVCWAVTDRRGVLWLSFDWTERGAPEQPRAARGTRPRRGFGTELIESRIPYELSGRGAVKIVPGGAQCHLEFPLKNGASILETGAPPRAVVFGGALDMTGEPDLSGYRILVLEDDYYLATDAARALRGAGAEIMGPCATEDAARAEIDEQRPDAAILDINLGEGPSFKIAEALKDQGIPFIFTTGYDPQVIPDEFSGVERLVKPIQLRHIVQAIAKVLTPGA